MRRPQISHEAVGLVERERVSCIVGPGVAVEQPGKLDDLRVPDPPSHILRRARHARPMEDERRHANGRQHVAHVRFRRHAEKGDCGTRAQTPAHVRYEPVSELRIVGTRGSKLSCELLEVRACSPPFSYLSQPLAPLRLRRRPRVVVSAQPARLRIEEYEARGSLGIGRSEQNCQSAALVRAPEDGPFRGCVVHDRAKVIHACLEGRKRDGSVREPRSALVEHDHAREVREAQHVSEKKRLVPRREQVSREPADEDEVDRALADQLVGDRHIAAARVTHFGHVHARKSPI